MKKHRFALIAALTMACSMSALTLPAQAATKQDVIDAARAKGIPELMIQQMINTPQFQNSTATDCDAAIDALDTYEEEIMAKVNEEMNKMTTAPVSGNTTQTTTVAVGTTPGAATTTPTQPNASFVNMTLEQKKAYVQSLPEAERTAFLANLTTAERNSILKQMSLTDKAEVLQSLIEATKGMGLNVAVDDIANDSLTLSVRDEAGKVVGIAPVGVVIDDTGISHTGWIVSAGTMMLLAGGGLLLLGRKLRKDASHDE